MAKAENSSRQGNIISPCMPSNAGVLLTKIFEAVCALHKVQRPARPYDNNPLHASTSRVKMVGNTCHARAIPPMPVQEWKIRSEEQVNPVSLTPHLGRSKLPALYTTNGTMQYPTRQHTLYRSSPLASAASAPASWLTMNHSTAWEVWSDKGVSGPAPRGNTMPWNQSEGPLTECTTLQPRMTPK